MNDSEFETRLRATLARHAGFAPRRTMPDGTSGKIRRRQLIFAGVAVMVTATFVGVSIMLVAVGTSAPGGEPRPRIVPVASGDSVQTTPPADWPTVTGAVDQPYIDRAMKLYEQSRTGITTAVSVLATGTVDGRPWLVTGFETDGGGDWGGATGACGNLFLHDPYNDAQPQFGTCLSPQGGPNGHTGRPAIARMEGGRSRPLGVTMYFGIVDGSVARIEVRLADGQTWDPPLIAGPTGSSQRYFVLFPPNHTEGTVAVIGSDGSELSEYPLCAASGRVTCEWPNP